MGRVGLATVGGLAGCEGVELEAECLVNVKVYKNCLNTHSGKTINFRCSRRKIMDSFNLMLRALYNSPWRSVLGTRSAN